MTGEYSGIQWNIYVKPPVLLGVWAPNPLPTPNKGKATSIPGSLSFASRVVEEIEGRQRREGLGARYSYNGKLEFANVNLMHICLEAIFLTVVPLTVNLVVLCSWISHCRLYSHILTFIFSLVISYFPYFKFVTFKTRVILCYTLRKEGRAFRNIGKYIPILCNQPCLFSHRHVYFKKKSNVSERGSFQT